MLQEIGTNTETSSVPETLTEKDSVTMSASAIEAVRGILAEKKLDGYSLRIYVAGGGCSGVNFGMTLDNNIRESDITFRTEDVQLVIDDQSITYLRGAKVDYVNDTERGAGFVVESPYKAGGCSCDSGGQCKSEDDSSGCGCGGSCG